MWVDSEYFWFQSLWLGDLGTQLGRKRLNVIVPSLKTRFGAPEPLVIWAQLHAAGSNLAVCLRTGPELFGTVATDGHVAPRGRARLAHTFTNHDEIFRRIQLAHGVISHPKHAL